jgi:hypothetical protein
MRPTTLICALAATLQVLSGTALASGGWTWPIRGPVITAYRNGDDPYAAGQHRGIDIGAPAGAPVVAATDGTVTFAGVVGSAGLVVSERSADGRFDLSYLHLSSASVHRGDRVTAGASVGAVGTSGQRSAEAPHLHFGVRDAGRNSAYRDPLDFLPTPPPADRPAPAPAPVPVGEPAAADPAPHPSGPLPSPASNPMPSPGSSPLPSHAPSPARPPLGAAAPLLGPSLAGAVDPHAASHWHAPPGRALPHILVSPGAVYPSAGHDGPRASNTPHTLAGPAATGPDGAAASPPAATRRRSLTQHAKAEHHGINLGWLAACIGLIALATALGHPDATHRVAARARAATSRRRSAAPARSHREALMGDHSA